MIKKNFRRKVREKKFNNSKLRKLYLFYLHQTMFDKVLDVLVFFAIILTFISLVAELFLHLPEVFMHWVHRISLVILVIFALELLREYALSPSNRRFFSKHWIDIILVVFLSLYFLFTAYFGAARLASLETIKNVANRFKYVRVITEYFFKH